MLDIASKTVEELEEIMKGYGQGKFRAKQLFSWIHEKKVLDYDNMSNLPKSLIVKLKEEWPLPKMNISEKYVSKEDGTIKYLFELGDCNIIESVLMRYKHGNSICISSQVGCRMGCKFCASTIDGLVRNLTPSEMLAQIYLISNDIEERISNVVIMGSGEPLERLELTTRFIELINDPKGQNIGQRHLTISTCGLVPKIYELADKKMQVTLALSLHATTDENRKRTMPIANKYTIAEVMEACNYYVEKTGRRVSFEYALIAGENDTVEDANRLVVLLKGMIAHVNLIPVNKVEERAYEGTNKQQVERFANILKEKNIETTIRRKLGSDIDAACGQLRRKYLNKRGE